MAPLVTATKTGIQVQKVLFHPQLRSRSRCPPLCVCLPLQKRPRQLDSGIQDAQLASAREAREDGGAGIPTKLKLQTHTMLTCSDSHENTSPVTCRPHFMVHKLAWLDGSVRSGPNKFPDTFESRHSHVAKLPKSRHALMYGQLSPAFFEAEHGERIGCQKHDQRQRHPLNIRIFS